MHKKREYKCLFSFFPCVSSSRIGTLDQDVFQLSVIYKLYRQVPTPVNNSQLLFKFRLETFHTCATQRNYKVRTGMNQFRRKMSVLVILIHDAPF
jgi:hypothetical protein